MSKLTIVATFGEVVYLELTLPIFLLGLFESIAMVTLAFVLIKAKMEWHKVSLIALVLTTVALFLRTLPITFGVHTIVNIFILIIVLSYFTKANLYRSILTGFISFIALMISETLSIYLILNFFNLSLDLIIEEPSLKILVSIPHILLLFIICLIIIYQRQRRERLDS